MILPADIQEKVKALFDGFDKEMLISKREQLTEKYKTHQAVNKSVFETNDDSAVYAISRMPATYAVVYSLLKTLMQEEKLSDIGSVIDIGSGTGSVFFAWRELFENATISLYERDKNMIDIFEQLVEDVKVNRFDILKDNLLVKGDLVISSYLFSELNEEGRKVALQKMLDCSNRYVLLIDTGTPRTYENFMKLKKQVLEMGYRVVAPCESEKCGLKDDYCQFYARVERSSLMRLSKTAELSYEDEKYFYLLISKDLKTPKIIEKRVIRRPQIKTNFVELKLCTCSGVVTENITKKDKELYKKVRKIKINEIL